MQSSCNTTRRLEEKVSVPWAAFFRARPKKPPLRYALPPYGGAARYSGCGCSVSCVIRIGSDRESIPALITTRHRKLYHLAVLCCTEVKRAAGGARVSPASRSCFHRGVVRHARDCLIPIGIEQVAYSRSSERIAMLLQQSPIQNLQSKMVLHGQTLLVVRVCGGRSGRLRFQSCDAAFQFSALGAQHGNLLLQSEQMRL